MPQRLIELIGIWIATVMVSAWISLGAFVALGAALLIGAGFWAYVLPSQLEAAVEAIFWAGLWLSGLASLAVGVWIGVRIWRSPWP